MEIITTITRKIKIQINQNFDYLYIESDTVNNFNDKYRCYTISQYEDELQSIDSEYKEVMLTDEEFNDMYELGYTLGTSSSGAFTTARRSDYNQYKSGRDVNGNKIRKDIFGDVIRVYKQRQFLIDKVVRNRKGLLRGQ